MLARMHEVPALRHLLPFVRQTYARKSTYWWADEVVRHRGGDRGDPLMPLLLSLATHHALAEVKAQLVEGEYLFAYLDDNFVSAKPDRIRTIYDLLGERLFSMAGIELHTGKTRTWNRREYHD